MKLNIFLLLAWSFGLMMFLNQQLEAAKVKYGSSSVELVPVGGRSGMYIPKTSAESRNSSFEKIKELMKRLNVMYVGREPGRINEDLNLTILYPNGSEVVDPALVADMNSRRAAPVEFVLTTFEGRHNPQEEE